MPDLADGESVEMKGSGAKPYVLKNTGGVYACSCPAWRNQSTPIERRTCKHLRRLRGDAAEEARLGGTLPQKPTRAAVGPDSEAEGAAGPPLLLAETWDTAADLSGWWMSEKLDGVRAYWDGKQFLSRLGNLYHAPEWFTEGLPNVPLDGELWIGRKKFQRTVSVVRRQDKTDLWNEVRFLVFDAPAAPGGFEDRVAFVNEALGSKVARFAAPHEHQVCKDLDCLRAELARVEALGGEGLMLRQPGSKYEAGRSVTLLKVKSFKDTEAVVVGHQAGTGRHKNRLGALLVRLPTGVEFAVGTGFSDRQREQPPPVGATVTFRYQELSEAGVPRFPSYVGERTDVRVTGAAPAAAPPPSRKVPTDGKPTDVVNVPVPGARPASPPSTTVPVHAARPDSAGGRPRYFEFVAGSSSKFWEVSVADRVMTTRWGRIGTAGQTKTKAFADATAAAKQAEKLIEEKTGDGYVEERA